jgi:hypothetical protein
MEQVSGYNEAVTKLRLLLDNSSNLGFLEDHQDTANAGGGQNRDFENRSGFNFSRLESGYGANKSKEASKRWSSQENLLHSNHTKGELRVLVTHQEDYIGQLEQELDFSRQQLGETINKVKTTALVQEKDTQDIIAKLKADNHNLKQQLESKHEHLR